VTDPIEHLRDLDRDHAASPGFGEELRARLREEFEQAESAAGAQPVTAAETDRILESSQPYTADVIELERGAPQPKRSRRVERALVAAVAAAAALTIVFIAADDPPPEKVEAADDADPDAGFTDDTATVTHMYCATYGPRVVQSVEGLNLPLGERTDGSTELAGLELERAAQALAEALESLPAGSAQAALDANQLTLDAAGSLREEQALGGAVDAALATLIERHADTLSLLPGSSECDPERLVPPDNG
jgi:hypothetical protein